MATTTHTGTNTAQGATETYTLHLHTAAMTFEYTCKSVFALFHHNGDYAWTKATGTMAPGNGVNNFTCTITRTQCLPSKQISAMRADPQMHGLTFTVQVLPNNGGVQWSSTSSKLPSSFLLQ